jgi:hypothetical protein
MILTLKDLRGWFEDLWNITVDANLAINNWRRLLVDKYEFDSESKSFGFFIHHTYQLRFIATIQLNKLLSSSCNEKRSFIHLFKQLIDSDYDQDFEELLRQNDSKNDDVFKTKNDIQRAVKFYKEQISNNKKIISKIVRARHNLYAHKAPNPNVPFISIDEIQGLIELSNEIYQKLSFGIFYSSPQITETHAWDVDPILFHMNESYKADRREIEKRKNSGT